MKRKKIKILSVILVIILTFLMTFGVSAHNTGHSASASNVKSVTLNTMTGQETISWSWGNTNDHPTLYVSNVLISGHLHCGTLPKYSVTEGTPVISWPSPTVKLTTTNFTAWYQGSVYDQ